mgnify:CR=1 FL=1
MTARINIPPSLHIGANAINLAGQESNRLRCQHVLIVSDPFIVESGLTGRVSDILSAEGIAATTFADVQPDPTDKNVLDGLAILKENGCDGLIAVGGGSSIDTAKGISVLATNPGSLYDFMGYDRIPEAGLPLIAVPTTAGTGSECTKVTVITDTNRDIKMMILDPYLLPAAALVDYTLTMSMPKSLTAHVGIDTLTHGLEAYVSKKANPMTDTIALSCIALVGRHLRDAWNDPQHEIAREGMMLAASQGGMAFANSSVCLVHGMSRPIGAMFHVPHGLSNAMLLPAVTEFSIHGAMPRYATVARTLGFSRERDSDELACGKLIEGLCALNEDLEVPRISECGISQEQFASVVEKMASDALASGSPQNNPVVPDAEAIETLYKNAY